MTNKITIDDLYADAGTFDQEDVLHMLKDKIAFTQEDEIIFVTDPVNLISSKPDSDLFLSKKNPKDKSKN